MIYNGLLILSQDPDLEAKRRAELEKIRSQKKKFKQKIQEHSETKTWTTRKETDQEKTDEKEKGSTGYSVKTLTNVYTTNFITVQYLIFSFVVCNKYEIVLNFTL